MTLAELRRRQRAYQRATQKAEQAMLDRDAAIRVALTDGWTHAQISEATGLTRGRIGQMAMRWKTR